jgi:CubicO group peptidase (beta-lactamase class C family)
MRPDALFHITPTTEPVVAVAAMILVEEGVPRLDEPWTCWCPSSTTGASSSGPTGRPGRLGTLPLLAQPDERWIYDTPAAVLAVLLTQRNYGPATPRPYSTTGRADR